MYVISEAIAFEKMKRGIVKYFMSSMYLTTFLSDCISFQFPRKVLLSHIFSKNRLTSVITGCSSLLFNATSVRKNCSLGHELFSSYTGVSRPRSAIFRIWKLSTFCMTNIFYRIYVTTTTICHLCPLDAVSTTTY